MTTPPRNPKRSRATTPRPRRIAGQGTAPDTDTPPAETVASATEPAARERPAAKPAAAKPAAAKPAAAPARGLSALVSSRRTTMVLVGVVGTLVVVLLAELAVGLRHQLRDDPAPPPAPPEGQIRMVDDAPVAMSELAVQEGVEAAAKAAREVVAIDYAQFTQEVQGAEALMTPSFAEEYRRTVDDVRAAYRRSKVVVQALVVGQGVVRANDTELQALVFLNQYVTKGVGPDSRTTVSQYRALVTVVHTDQGWLVDGLLTK